MAPAVRMYIDKFKGVVLINEDHPLAVAQRAKDAAAKAAVKPASAAAAPAVARESATTTDTPPAPAPAVSEVPDSQPGLFDLPPEQRELPAVQAYLASLEGKTLRELGKEHGVRPNQKADAIVEQLTIKLTTPAAPAQPPEPLTG